MIIIGPWWFERPRAPGAAAGDPSPVRRSLTCEAKVGFGRMRTAASATVPNAGRSNRGFCSFGFLGFCLQKESSNQIRRSMRKYLDLKIAHFQPFTHT